MPSQDVSMRIDRVRGALDEKGFEGIEATHYDNTPNRLIVLRDDGGRIAHGEDEAMKRIIMGADDEAGLWAALADSGMVRGAMPSRS